MLKVRDRSIWIAFQYEKIPRFYFKCGVICQGRAGCLLGGSRKIHGKEVNNQFRPWLRALSPKRWLDRNKGRYGGDSTENAGCGRWGSTHNW